jgi:hypothetical protein
MKILLGCLMCIVLPVSQGFAISGGPFGASSQVNVVGTYAGVLLPVPQELAPGVVVSDTSMALFTLTVPQSGKARGTVAIFRNSNSYTGDMQAFADPANGKISGVISAIHTQSVTLPGNGGSVTFVYNDLANGRLQTFAQVLPNATSTRLRGQKSSITFTTTNPNDVSGNSGGPVFYKVRGFKQSTGTNSTNSSSGT